MLDSLCTFVSQFLPSRDITGGDGSPYLRRFRVFDRGRDKYRLFLHEFHRGDEDREIHNHPWAWCYSLILHGGYRESRLYAFQHLAVDRVEKVRMPIIIDEEYRAFAINAIGPDTFHRVELLDGKTWSLILTGPIVQSWGFMNRNDGAFTPWFLYLAKKFGKPVEDVDRVEFNPPSMTPGEWLFDKLLDMLDRVEQVVA